MDFITPAIKPSIDAVKSLLGAAGRQWGKRKYEQLLSATISELLKQHPDLTAAEANLAAAEATGVVPDINLLRAKSMYGSAHRFHRAVKKVAAKKRKGGPQPKKASRVRKCRMKFKRKV